MSASVVSQEVSFRVVPEGSVLKRTWVPINGVKGELTEIPADKKVNVYWLPDFVPALKAMPLLTVLALAGFGAFDWSLVAAAWCWVG